ncbi:unnamed protein product [Arabidopsis thaliana]|uniref:Uncharacterized protein n=1 Tax=Arabidopsis thaliana TaxID=3702 RepID=A0A654EKC1_ARATH|nr:unnamed protein product [Arabidopsis thaliana]
MSPRASFHLVAEENRCHAWAEMDSSRPFGWRYIRNVHEIPRCPRGHRFHPPRLDGRASLKAWIRLSCLGGEQGVSVAYGHRHLVARN